MDKRENKLDSSGAPSRVAAKPLSWSAPLGEGHAKKEGVPRVHRVNYLLRPQLAGPGPARFAHPSQVEWINRCDHGIGWGDVNL